MKKLNNNLDISPYVRQKIFLVMKFIPVFFSRFIVFQQLFINPDRQHLNRQKSVRNVNV